MVDGIGSNGLARAAIEAALRSTSGAAARIDRTAANNFELGELVPDVPNAPSKSADLGSGILSQMKDVNAGVNQIEALPVDMINGKIHDFHELAAQIKTAELSFKFAMEVRNKLIDAYRETMRMNV